jgi:hypothetical protein
LNNPLTSDALAVTTDKHATMPQLSTTAQETDLPRRGSRIAVRFAVFILLAFIIGWMIESVAKELDRTGRPAGFTRGVIQGALMPASMPNLLIGRDVTIYSANNNGVLYKLGYTMGVNACGALFFGFFYWRLKRWRQRR